MIIEVMYNYSEMSIKTAEFIIEMVNKNPNALLCLAGGDTPIETYRLLVKASKEERVDFSQCKFVSLDEWVGLDENDEGSCKYFLYKEIFKPLNINKENICFFNAKCGDLQKECKRVDEFIFKNGPIDIILLGIGVNGHLGFNEPGIDFENYCHVLKLDKNTQTVGQKYFNKEMKLEYGISLGIKHILEAKTAILIANGEKKANIIKNLVEKDVTNEIPATALKLHANSFLFLDSDAAKLTHIK